MASIGAAVRSYPDVKDGPYPSTAEQPCARLINFPTGKADLTGDHKAWLSMNVVTAFENYPDGYLNVAGLASRLGNATKNATLAVARAEAVVAYVEDQLGKSLLHTETGGYGESLSGGKSNDDDAFYRAALVTVSESGYRAPPPKYVPVAPVKKAKPLGVWCGVGVKVGTHLVIGGYDDAEIPLFNIQSYEQRFWLNVTTKRFGLGLGGSGGVVIGIVTGLPDASAFGRVSLSDWDFQISIGKKWKGALHSIAALAGVKKYAAIAKAGQKLASVDLITKGDWEQLVVAAKTLIAESGIRIRPKTPQVYVMDVPFSGLGAELSLYWGWGTATRR